MTDKQKRMLEGLALFARAAWECPVDCRESGPMGDFVHQLAGFVLDLHEDAARASAQPREADCHGRGNCGNPDVIPGRTAQPSEPEKCERCGGTGVFTRPAGDGRLGLTEEVSCSPCPWFPKQASSEPAGEVTTDNLTHALEAERLKWPACDRLLRAGRADIARATAADRATIAELREQIAADNHTMAADERTMRELTKQHEADAARVRELEAELERVRALAKEHGQKMFDARKERDAYREHESERRYERDVAQRDRDAARAELETVKAKLGWRTELLKMFASSMHPLPPDYMSLVNAELATDHEQPVAADGEVKP